MANKNSNKLSNINIQRYITYESNKRLTNIVEIYMTD